MSDHLSHQANPVTRGTVPVQFFEADGGAPPPGSKATPRPADRPRELPASSPLPTAFHLFETDAACGAQQATARPARQGEAANNHPDPPQVHRASPDGE
jgi:hypothetical protein